MLPNTGRGGERARAACFSAALAALGVVLAWGFTVDDAWISARVASRVANGIGYRFNAHGPLADAVTPLGWAWVLAPFARHSVHGAIEAARILGSSAWVLAAAWFGFGLAANGKNPNRLSPLLAVAPVGAWACSGMETGVVLALATVAIAENFAGAVAAAVVAGWRPELIPFCLVLAMRPLAAKKLGNVRRWLPLGLAVAAPVLVALIRQFVFGRPFPLAVLAKPSDIEHGVRYGLGALLFLGPTWLWAGGGWKGISTSDRIVAGAVVAHGLAIVAAGGDWMPLWRLAVPAIPAALWVSASLQERQRPALVWLRLCVASAVAVYVWVAVGLPARHVMLARLSLVEQGHRALAGSRLVASLDVGWVGAAFPGDVLDLAGVTDARVARLAGGHTTKKIPNSWFDSMQPDALVLLTAPGQIPREPWNTLQFARGIENRIRDMQYFEGCRLSEVLKLLHTDQSYVVVRCPAPH